MARPTLDGAVAGVVEGERPGPGRRPDAHLEGLLRRARPRRAVAGRARDVPLGTVVARHAVGRGEGLPSDQGAGPVALGAGKRTVHLVSLRRCVAHTARDLHVGHVGEVLHPRRAAHLVGKPAPHGRFGFLVRGRGSDRGSRGGLVRRLLRRFLAASHGRKGQNDGEREKAGTSGSRRTLHALLLAGTDGYEVDGGERFDGHEVPASPPPT
jgi:hypothetical protein